MTNAKYRQFSFKNGKIHSESHCDAINLSKFCLHLTTDNGNDTGAQLFICDEHSHGGDIEKQLHKSLVRVIGETNAINVTMIKLRLISRHVDFVAPADYHAVCAVAVATIQNESWKMFDVSHYQFDSSVHLPDPRSNGHPYHEDSLAVRVFWVYDVHQHPILYILAQRYVLRHLEDV